MDIDLLHLFKIGLAAAVVNNYVLTKFLGLCPYFGVSKKVETGLGMAVAVVFVMVIASVGALPLALPFGHHAATDWLLVGYLGVFQIALAYVLVTKALEALPALEASLILLIEPVLNPVWAWVFQGERPGAWALAGGGVILGATTVRSLLDARRAPEQAVVPAG